VVVTHVLLDLVARAGYAVVFLGVGIESLGVPVPGETALVIGAVLAGQGRLEPWLVALVGWLGAVLGDNTGYWIGRRYGRRLLAMRGFRRVYDERRIAVAERFFERWGALAVFAGRFVAILRIFAGPLAGMYHMPWRRFVIANATGGATWVAVVTTIGVLLGSNLDRAVRVVSRMGFAGLGLAALVVAGAVAVHVVRGRRERAAGARHLEEKRAAGTQADATSPGDPVETP
jgi:membrane protein DedA with SNARE-associated domain